MNSLSRVFPAPLSRTWPDRVGIARALVRSAGLLLLFAAAGFHYVATVPKRRRYSGLRFRARWLQVWTRRLALLFGLRICRYGEAPLRGMLASNHLSYLDILVLSACVPCVFVAKKEVARWPLLGMFARMAGTLFVDRERRADVARVRSRIHAALHAGVVVILFPEGTSSGGHTVLPFKSSLLEPVAAGRNPVAAAAISYSLEEGSVSDEVCYWRDMTLLPHLMNLLAKRRVQAQVTFGAAAPRPESRKALAHILREEIAVLRSRQTIPDQNQSR